MATLRDALHEYLSGTDGFLATFGDIEVPSRQERVLYESGSTAVWSKVAIEDARSLFSHRTVWIACWQTPVRAAVWSVREHDAEILVWSIKLLSIGVDGFDPRDILRALSIQNRAAEQLEFDFGRTMRSAFFDPEALKTAEIFLQRPPHLRTLQNYGFLDRTGSHGYCVDEV